MTDIIRIDAIRRGKTNNVRQLASGLILPASERVGSIIAIDRAAEPIKSMDDIDRISKLLIDSGRYRDNMLFIVGINFGLRVGDLRMLRFADLITDTFVFRDSFPVFEQKTRNTRKKRKNRYISINDAVIEAVTLYLEKTPNVKLSDYMFSSSSNNGGSKNTPLTIQSVDRILKGIARDLGLTMKISTHSLRKTFCYHQMLMAHNDPRRLLLLQKMLGHSTPAQTLDYIGITAEEMDEAYKSLNLGSKHSYLNRCEIYEVEAM